MLIVDNCADVSLALRDWTKDNLCLFDVVAVPGACDGCDLEGEGHGYGILASFVNRNESWCHYLSAWHALRILLNLHLMGAYP